jgi:hypothetical protein
VGRAAHLTKRFFGSLRPGGPPRDDLTWVAEQLSPAELALWQRMSGPDRRHSVVVAHRVERALGDEATRPVLAAALLHDVGKIEAHLRTYGRVIATGSAAAAGPEAAYDWVKTTGFTRRVGLYVLHPKYGGDHLGMIGSDPFTEAWTREHHLPEDQWTVDIELGRVLKACDDD